MELVEAYMVVNLNEICPVFSWSEDRVWADIYSMTSGQFTHIHGLEGRPHVFWFE